jgi:hypothetical protein
MKSNPVVSLSLTAFVCLSACSSGNGTLFDPLAGARDGTGEPAPDGMTNPPPPALSPSTVAPSDGEAPPTTPEAVGVGVPFVANLPGRTPLSPGAPAPVAPASPTVLSVSPADGAVGVKSDASIVIRFSEPMDRLATQAAYQSESVPSGSVTFSWNDESTELTVLPDAPLEYSTGDDPELVEARSMSFFISASAANAAGNHLAQPYEFSFALLRQIELTLFAVQDRDLSGSFRSNDTYGAGQCARDQVNMCVGDVRVGGASEQYKGFISFELVDVPDAVQDFSALLSLEITGMAGNPFGGLGGLVLEHAAFDTIGAGAFSADALDEVGLIAVDGGAGTIVNADVSAAFMTDQFDRGLTQYRLRFEDETDGDITSDTVLSAWDTQTLDVTYLLP